MEEDGKRCLLGCLVQVLVLLSQDLPSPFVIVRFARILVPKRNSVYIVHD